MEAGFVLFSILLAFSIDAWWDDRQALRVESAILDRLEEELARNRASLDRALSLNRSLLEQVDLYLQANPAALAALPQDSVNVLAVAIAVPSNYTPETDAAALFLETPIIDAGVGVEARSLVSRWLRALQVADDHEAMLLAESDAALDILAMHVTAGAQSGAMMIPQMVARQGADAFSTLRSNDELTSVVIRKAHSQRAYLSFLDDTRPLLDSLSSVLSARQD